MEEEATQPATQLVMDPRRLGHHNSGLNDEDLADIFCILHPASMSACLVAAHIAKECPEHTISNTGVEVKVRGGSNSPVKAPTTSDLAAQGVASRDIALRLSADLKDPMAGFLFGRHEQRCDFVISGTEGAKRVSNVHFRIYINEHGVIMLEDQSTNGTQVEMVMLSAKLKKEGHQYKHTLQQGSLITLVMTPPEEDIRFVVRIPQREGEYEAMYDQNLQNYFQRLYHFKQARESERAALKAKANGNAGGAHEGPPDIFAPITQRAPSVSPMDIGLKQWRGGSKYNLVKLAGKGAFANVYVMSTKFDGTLVAAKELEKRKFMKKGVLDQKIDSEIKIMSRIDHPHVVKFIEAIDWEQYIYLIMEYVPHKDLGFLMSDKARLQEDTVKIIARQLLSALKYLHEMGITHRDVKPDNILIQKLDPLQVKLTDFGLSKMVHDEETFLRTFCGTLLYCAPEVYTEYHEYDAAGNRTLRGKDKQSLPKQRYGHAVDLWSLGSVLFYTLCGSPPYPAATGTNYPALLNTIMTKPLDIRPLQLAGVSEAGIRFVRSMLQVNPRERATVEELESSSWLGEGSIAMSVDEDEDEEDEVDMIRGQNRTNLEEGASQLSIHNGVEYGNGYDQDLETEIAGPYLTESGRVIPSSFRSANSTSSESFAFMRQPPGNARLFGEVNVSALGSSGVIPRDRLNLPLSAFMSEDDNHESASHLNFSTSIENTSQLPAAHVPMEGLTPTQSPVIISESTAELDIPSSHPIAAPSLFGAESMVGQLQMDEPSPVTGAPVQDSPTPEFHDPNISRRRPLDESTGSDEAHPTAKRLKSSREIEIPVSKTVFWDERNKSTWHNNYPDMMLSQYTEAVDVAKAHGEQFRHGEKIFEMYVGSYRKTPSVEPEVQLRAQSEPAGGLTRKALMKRDGRKLEDMTDVQLPSTTCGESIILAGLDNTQIADQARRAEAILASGKDAAFKSPKRILGKLIATPDSVLPSISFNITDIFTSWGRGYANTIIFADGYEDRVPKYALKLMLWKQGLSPVRDQPLERDMSFWISTKATMGIKINGIHLKSHESKERSSASKYWGELKHGDEVTVWTKENRETSFVKLRFECYFGPSEIARREGDPPFSILAKGEVSDELDAMCLQKEAEIKAIAEQANVEGEEKENAKEKGFPLPVFRPAPFLTD